MLKLEGTTTTMRRASRFKRPVYGGFPDMAPMWHSEIAWDLLVILSIQLLAGHAVASLLLLTPLGRVTSNRVLLLLQRRYVVVGWDAFVSMAALGIDPFHGTITTNCTMAALTRQLSVSGPNASVRFAGDDALSARSARVHTSSPGRTTPRPSRVEPMVGIVWSVQADSPWGELMLVSAHASSGSCPRDGVSCDHGEIPEENPLDTLARTQRAELLAGKLKLHLS